MKFLRKIFPNDPEDKRRWHQKKRYRLLLAIVAISLVSNALEVDSETVVAESSTSYEDSFGDFTAQSYSKTGSDQIDIDFDYGVLRINHQGEGNFTLVGKDADNETELNLRASSEFQTELDLGFTNSGITQLEITTESSWTIELLPVAEANYLTESAIGNGVFIYDGPEVDWSIENSEGVFELIQVDMRTRQERLLNRAGEFESTVEASAGPSVVIIRASDRWSIEPQQ